MIRFEKIVAPAVWPEPACEHDAAYDLAALDAVTILPGDRLAVGTGIRCAIEPGACGLVLPRSGLAITRGVTVLNAPGLIDPGYRGEIAVLLINHGRESWACYPGDRIAQLLVAACYPASPLYKMRLPERGAGGLGSTGR